MNEDLRLRTKQFALRIIRMFVALPKTDVARVLGRQVLRSGTSVGANYLSGVRHLLRCNNGRPSGSGTRLPRLVRCVRTTNYEHEPKASH